MCEEIKQSRQQLRNEVLDVMIWGSLAVIFGCLLHVLRTSILKHSESIVVSLSLLFFMLLFTTWGLCSLYHFWIKFIEMLAIRYKLKQLNEG